MSIISEISNANQYAGNAGIGGAALGAIEIDTKPLQQLAAYTVMYNKAEYDQRQKDAEAAAKEITDYTSYDLTSGIDKDAKVLQSRYDELVNLVRDNPESLNYNNKKAWAEYKKKRGELENDIKGGGIRNTIKLVRDKEISDEKNVGRKAQLQKDLDAEIARSDIRTPLKHTNQYEIEPAKYAVPKNLKFTVVKELPNIDTLANVSTTDMADVNNQANAVVTGLAKFLNPQTDLEKQQYEAQSVTGKLEPILSAQNISSIIPQFVKDGKFDYEGAKNSGNTILSGNAANVEAYNRKMREMKAAIKAGAFKDKLSGGVAAFGVNGLNENDYQEIDLGKGSITPTEYAKLNIMGLAEPTVTSETDIKVTGFANALKLKSMDEAGANYRAKLAKDVANAPLVMQPGLLFQEHISNINSGFASPKAIQGAPGLVVSYAATDEITKKALGIATDSSETTAPEGYITYLRDGTAMVGTDKNGKGGTPLTIEQQKNGFINAVKGGNKDAALDAKFAIDTETGFNKIFGTSDANAIWKGKGTPEVKTDDSKLSDGEYYMKYKKVRKK